MNVAVDAVPLEDRAPLAALIRARDWAATPVGPVERWPPSLRTALTFRCTRGTKAFFALRR